MDKIKPIRIESERAVQIVDLHNIGSVSFLAQTLLITLEQMGGSGEASKENDRSLLGSRFFNARKITLGTRTASRTSTWSTHL